MKPRRLISGAAAGPALALVLLLAACGSSKPAADGSPSTSSAPGTAVTIKMFAFTPQQVTVKAGTTVMWTNTDQILHTVTAGADEKTLTGMFDGQLDGAGTTFRYTFKDPGTYKYLCTRHAVAPSMHGEIVVT